MGDAISQELFSYARRVLGELPQEWQYARLGELEEEGIIEDIQDGNHGELHPKSSDYVSTGIPFVMAKNLVNGHVDLSNCHFIRKEQAESLRIGFAKPGDVLLTHKAVLGRVAIVPEGHEYIMLTPQVTYYRIGNTGELTAEFLKYAFLSPPFQYQLHSTSDQSTRKYIGITAQRDLWIPLPPRPEQEAIARILGTLDDKIELNRRMNETLEAMARAIFKSWFVDFDPVRAKAEGRQLYGMDADTAALFPDLFQDSSLGKIPKGWVVGTLGKEFQITMGQSPPGRTYNEAEEGLPFYQGCRDFQFRYPSRRAYCVAPTRVANPGDTLVSVRAPVGKSNMAVEKCCIGRGLAAVRHVSMSRSYSYYAMKTLAPDFATFEGEGTVFGSINKMGFQELAWTIAPMPLVDAFERCAYPLDQQVEVNESECATLAAIRDTLLPKLISGEIRVSELQQEEDKAPTKDNSQREVPEAKR